MSEPPDDAEDSSDRAAAAMQAQLRKDVAAWSAARSGSASRQAEEFTVPVTRPPVRQARKAPPAKPAASVAGAPKQPFRMSYGGAATGTVRGKVDRGTR